MAAESLSGNFALFQSEMKERPRVADILGSLVHQGDPMRES